jgi:hypothetical protein
MAKHSSIHLPAAICVLVLLLAQWPGGARAESAATREYQVKAAFLYNFAQFVEWPDEAFPDGKSAPIVIGIVGENPFGTALDQAVRGKSVDGRPIVVRYFNNVAAAEPCQILFLAASERDRVQQALDKAGGITLTVGDFDGFTASGGIFRFLTEDNKVRFEANLDAARGSRVKISAKLLKLAKIRGK